MSTFGGTRALNRTHQQISTLYGFADQQEQVPTRPNSRKQLGYAKPRASPPLLSPKATKKAGDWWQPQPRRRPHMSSSTCRVPQSVPFERQRSHSFRTTRVRVYEDSEMHGPIAYSAPYDKMAKPRVQTHAAGRAKRIAALQYSDSLMQRAAVKAERPLWQQHGTARSTHCPVTLIPTKDRMFGETYTDQPTASASIKQRREARSRHLRNQEMRGRAFNIVTNREMDIAKPTRPESPPTRIRRIQQARKTRQQVLQGTFKPPGAHPHPSLASNFIPLDSSFMYDQAT